MPSGPKKRLRAKRRKQGSPATDANSDRETEAMSITGSMDVDDLDSGLDTPGKFRERPPYLDREAVSSQTDEWVRLSDFDVGTPTSQTGENEPSAEYVDITTSGRSLDKLAEWETVSGEQIPERQEESINSLEEEPSEVEVVSGHSSESYTHLPSPHPPLDKDGNSSGSDRKKRKGKTSRHSSSSSSSNSSSDEKPSLRSANKKKAGKESSSASLPSPIPKLDDQKGEEVSELNEDPVEKEVVHEGPAERDVDGADEPPLAKEAIPAEALIGPNLMGEPAEENLVPPRDEAALPARDLDVEKEIISTSAKDISEVETPLNSPVAEVTIHEDKDVVPIQVDEKAASSSLGDVEDKQVNGDGKIAEDKEVASTSADLDDEERTVDEPGFKYASFAEKNPSYPQELTIDTIAAKELPTSQGSEPLAFVEERHLSITLADKKGIEKERSQLEPKSGSGCCGVISWLLGWDH